MDTAKRLILSDKSLELSERCTRLSDALKNDEVSERYLRMFLDQLHRDVYQMIAMTRKVKDDTRK